MNDSIVKLKEVQFSYPGGVNAIRDISFEIRRGEKVAVLGPNGSGKSTLILLMAGLMTPKKGEITVFGEKTTSKNFQKLRQRVGIVFQDPDDQLFTQSVVEDIEYGPRNLKIPEPDIKKRSTAVLLKIGIQHLENRPPHRLSFGEKKKVSLATALVLKPDLLILDEPTANLDLVSRRSLINTLNELNREGTTVFISTHDVEALPELADRVIVMSNGSLLGEGATADVLQDTKLLNTAGLEPPSIVKLFLQLKEEGLIQDVPTTVKDAEQKLTALMKKNH